MFPFLPANRLYRHLLFWTLVAIYFWFPQWVYPDYIDTVTHYFFNFNYQHSPYFLTILFGYTLGVGMLYAYAFLHWAVPLLQAGRYGLGIGLCVGITVAVCYLYRLLKGLHLAVLDPLLRGQPMNPFDTRHLDGLFVNQVYIHEYSTIILVLAVYKFFGNWYYKQQQTNRLEREKISTDIQLLKAQVNPNLVLRSLDHLQLLTQQHCKQAPEVVLTLAQFLRYVLYESQADRVLLVAEIDNINRYVMLQRVTYPTELDISFIVRGDIDGLFVAPLSLFPIVERAFYHLTRLPTTDDSATDDPAWVSIDLAVEVTRLTFKVISGQPVSPPDEVNWLADVRKQLLYYYGGDFDLQMRSEPDMHLVSLQLPLTEQSDGLLPHPKPGDSQFVPATKPL